MNQQRLLQATESAIESAGQSLFKDIINEGAVGSAKVKRAREVLETLQNREQGQLDLASTYTEQAILQHLQGRVNGVRDFYRELLNAKDGPMKELRDSLNAKELARVERNAQDTTLRFREEALSALESFEHPLFQTKDIVDFSASFKKTISRKLLPETTSTSAGIERSAAIETSSMTPEMRTSLAQAHVGRLFDGLSPDIGARFRLRVAGLAVHSAINELIPDLVQQARMPAEQRALLTPYMQAQYAAFAGNGDTTTLLDEITQGVSLNDMKQLSSLLQPIDSSDPSLDIPQLASTRQYIDDLIVQRETGGSVSASAETSVAQITVPSYDVNQQLKSIMAKHPAHEDDVYQLYTGARDSASLSMGTEDLDAFIPASTELQVATEAVRNAFAARNPGRTLAARTSISNLGWQYFIVEGHPQQSVTNVGARFYLNLDHGHTAERDKVLNDLMTRLGDAHKAFELKTTLLAKHAERTDNTVLYVETQNIQDIQRILIDVYNAHPTAFRNSVPLLTRQIAPGISAAAHIPGRSFGDMISKAFISGQRESGEEAQLAATKAALAASGLNPERPYLRSDWSDDPFMLYENTIDREDTQEERSSNNREESDIEEPDTDGPDTQGADAEAPDAEEFDAEIPDALDAPSALIAPDAEAVGVSVLDYFEILQLLQYRVIDATGLRYQGPDGTFIARGNVRSTVAMILEDSAQTEVKVEDYLASLDELGYRITHATGARYQRTDGQFVSRENVRTTIASAEHRLKPLYVVTVEENNGRQWSLPVQEGQTISVGSVEENTIVIPELSSSSLAIITILDGTVYVFDHATVDASRTDVIRSAADVSKTPILIGNYQIGARGKPIGEAYAVSLVQASDPALDYEVASLTGPEDIEAGDIIVSRTGAEKVVAVHEDGFSMSRNGDTEAYITDTEMVSILAESSEVRRPVIETIDVVVEAPANQEVSDILPERLRTLQDGVYQVSYNGQTYIEKEYHPADNDNLDDEPTRLQKLSELENVPRFIDYVTYPDGSRTFLMTEIPGTPLSEADAVPAAFFDELASLVREAHAAGVIHSDLWKPENIIVTPEGKPAIIDWDTETSNDRSTDFAMLEDLREGYADKIETGATEKIEDITTEEHPHRPVTEWTDAEIEAVIMSLPDNLIDEAQTAVEAGDDSALLEEITDIPIVDPTIGHSTYTEAFEALRSEDRRPAPISYETAAKINGLYTSIIDRTSSSNDLERRQHATLIFNLFVETLQDSVSKGASDAAILSDLKEIQAHLRLMHNSYVPYVYDISLIDLIQKKIPELLLDHPYAQTAYSNPSERYRPADGERYTGMLVADFARALEEGDFQKASMLLLLLMQEGTFSSTLFSIKDLLIFIAADPEPTPPAAFKSHIVDDETGDLLEALHSYTLYSPIFIRVGAEQELEDAIEEKVETLNTFHPDFRDIYAREQERLSDPDDHGAAIRSVARAFLEYASSEPWIYAKMGIRVDMPQILQEPFNGVRASFNAAAGDVETLARMQYGMDWEDTDERDLAVQALMLEGLLSTPELQERFRQSIKETFGGLNPDPIYKRLMGDKNTRPTLLKDFAPYEQTGIVSALFGAKIWKVPAAVGTDEAFVDFATYTTLMEAAQRRYYGEVVTGDVPVEIIDPKLYDDRFVELSVQDASEYDTRYQYEKALRKARERAAKSAGVYFPKSSRILIRQGASLGDMISIYIHEMTHHINYALRTQEDIPFLTVTPEHIVAEEGLAVDFELSTLQALADEYRDANGRDHAFDLMRLDQRSKFAATTDDYEYIIGPVFVEALRRYTNDDRAFQQRILPALLSVGRSDQDRSLVKLQDVIDLAEEIREMADSTPSAAGLVDTVTEDREPVLTRPAYVDDETPVQQPSFVQKAMNRAIPYILIPSLAGAVAIPAALEYMTPQSEQAAAIVSSAVSEEEYAYSADDIRSNMIDLIERNKRGEKNSFIDFFIETAEDATVLEGEITFTNTPDETGELHTIFSLFHNADLFPMDRVTEMKAIPEATENGQHVVRFQLMFDHTGRESWTDENDITRYRHDYADGPIYLPETIEFVLLDGEISWSSWGRKKSATGPMIQFSNRPEHRARVANTLASLIGKPEITRILRSGDEIVVEVLKPNGATTVTTKDPSIFSVNQGSEADYDAMKTGVEQRTSVSFQTLLIGNKQRRVGAFVDHEGNRKTYVAADAPQQKKEEINTHEFLHNLMAAMGVLETETLITGLTKRFHGGSMNEAEIEAVSDFDATDLQVNPSLLAVFANGGTAQELYERAIAIYGTEAIAPVVYTVDFYDADGQPTALLNSLEEQAIADAGAVTERTIYDNNEQPAQDIETDTELQETFQENTALPQALAQGKTTVDLADGTYHKISNNMEYKVASIEIAYLIDEVADAWHDEVAASGLETDNKFLVITSAIRTKEFQRTLREQGYPAALESSHTRRVAFDIGKQWFDEHAPEYGAALERVLSRMESEGKVHLIKEDVIGAWHIMIMPDYRREVRQELLLEHYGSESETAAIDALFERVLTEEEDALLPSQGEEAFDIAAHTPCQGSCTVWDDYKNDLRSDFDLSASDLGQVLDTMHAANIALQYLANEQNDQAQLVLDEARSLGWIDTAIEKDVEMHIKKSIARSLSDEELGIDQSVIRNRAQLIKNILAKDASSTPVAEILESGTLGSVLLGLRSAGIYDMSFPKTLPDGRTPFPDVLIYSTLDELRNTLEEINTELGTDFDVVPADYIEDRDPATKYITITLFSKGEARAGFLASDRLTSEERALIATDEGLRTFVTFVADPINSDGRMGLIMGYGTNNYLRHRGRTYTEDDLVRITDTLLEENGRSIIYSSTGHRDGGIYWISYDAAESARLEEKYRRGLAIARELMTSPSPSVQEERNQEIAAIIQNIGEQGLLSPRKLREQQFNTRRGADEHQESNTDAFVFVSIIDIPTKEEFDATGDTLLYENYEDYRNELEKRLIDLETTPDDNPIAILAERDFSNFALRAEVEAHGRDVVEERLASGILFLIDVGQQPDALAEWERRKTDSLLDYNYGGFEQFSPDSIQAIFVPEPLLTVVEANLPENMQQKIVVVRDTVRARTINENRGEDRFFLGDLQELDLVLPNWFDTYTRTIEDLPAGVYAMHGMRLPTETEIEKGSVVPTDDADKKTTGEDASSANYFTHNGVAYGKEEGGKMYYDFAAIRDAFPDEKPEKIVSYLFLHELYHGVLRESGLRHQFAAVATRPSTVDQRPEHPALTGENIEQPAQTERYIDYAQEELFVHLLAKHNAHMPLSAPEQAALETMLREDVLPVASQEIRAILFSPAPDLEGTTRADRVRETFFQFDPRIMSDSLLLSLQRSRYAYLLDAIEGADLSGEAAVQAVSYTLQDVKQSLPLDEVFDALVRQDFSEISLNEVHSTLRHATFRLAEVVSALSDLSDEERQQIIDTLATERAILERQMQEEGANRALLQEQIAILNDILSPIQYTVTLRDRYVSYDINTDTPYEEARTDIVSAQPSKAIQVAGNVMWRMTSAGAWLAQTLWNALWPSVSIESEPLEERRPAIEAELQLAWSEPIIDQTKAATGESMFGRTTLIDRPSLDDLIKDETAFNLRSYEPYEVESVIAGTTLEDAIRMSGYREDVLAIDRSAEHTIDTDTRTGARLPAPVLNELRSESTLALYKSTAADMLADLSRQGYATFTRIRATEERPTWKLWAAEKSTGERIYAISDITSESRIIHLQAMAWFSDVPAQNIQTVDYHYDYVNDFTTALEEQLDEPSIIIIGPKGPFLDGYLRNIYLRSTELQHLQALFGLGQGDTVTKQFQDFFARDGQWYKNFEEQTIQASRIREQRKLLVSALQEAGRNREIPEIMQSTTTLTPAVLSSLGIPDEAAHTILAAEPAPLPDLYATRVAPMLEEISTRFENRPNYPDLLIKDPDALWYEADFSYDVGAAIDNILGIFTTHSLVDVRDQIRANADVHTLRMEVQTPHLAMTPFPVLMQDGSTRQAVITNFPYGELARDFTEAALSYATTHEVSDIVYTGAGGSIGDIAINTIYLPTSVRIGDSQTAIPNAATSQEHIGAEHTVHASVHTVYEETVPAIEHMQTGGIETVDVEVAFVVEAYRDRVLEILSPLSVQQQQIVLDRVMAGTAADAALDGLALEQGIAQRMTDALRALPRLGIIQHVSDRPLDGHQNLDQLGFSMERELRMQKYNLLMDHLGIDTFAESVHGGIANADIDICD
jgi:predicted Ser/Thr protein kinase